MPQIRNRYTQMHGALQSGAFDKARQLIAPNVRQSAAHRTCDLLKAFVEPLQANSVIVVAANRAYVFPKPGPPSLAAACKSLLGNSLSARGNYLVMVKIDSDWFFTGGIHVD